MSLQVWLPLNGDLRNQGLMNKTLSNTDATISNNGKIGQCYDFNGTTSYIGCNDITGLDPSTLLSVACWAKIDSSATEGKYICGLSAPGSGAFMLYCSKDDNVFSICAYFGDVRSATKVDITNYLDTWHHYAMVYDGAKIYMYIDGEQKNVTAYTMTSSARNAMAETYIYLGKRKAGTKNIFKGSLNDFRFYDHALSAKEVAELSKGLVLHYKLDDNINNTNWLLPNSETTITRSSSNTSVDYEYYPDLVSNTETQYMVDFYARGSVAGMQMDVYFRSSSGTAYVSTDKITLTANWQHYSFSLTGSPSRMEKFRARCYSGTADDIIYIRNMKLLSNNMPIRTSIIYDSSGYGNNGTIVGTLTAAAGSSPRYGSSTLFNSSAINAGKGALVRDAISFGCWAYMDSWSNYSTNSRLMACADSSGWNFAAYQSTDKIYIYLGTGESSNTYKNIVSNTTWSSLSSGWHHFMVTYDGKIGVLYIDGNPDTTITPYNEKVPLYYKSTSVLFIGTGLSSNSGNPNTNYFNGKMSDVRIYATALTATQVKELYNTSMTVDAAGNAYARELMEVSTNLGVNKQGQAAFGDFEEVSANQASIKKANTDNEQELDAYELYEY